MISEAKQDLDQLGPGPEGLKVQDVMLEIAANLGFAEIAQNLVAVPDDGSIPDWTITMSEFHPKTMALELPLWPIALRDVAALMDRHPPQGLAEALQLECVAAAALAAIEEWLDNQEYLEVVYAAVEEAFGADTPMQLHRFSALQEEIVSEYLEGCHWIPSKHVRTAIMVDIQPLAAMLRLNVHVGNCPPDKQVHGHLAIMERAVHTAIMQKVLYLLECGGFIGCVPDDFPLEKRPEAERKRTQLEKRLEDLHHAHAVISSIQHQDDAS